jgi:hypothetical protein
MNRPSAYSLAAGVLDANKENSTRVASMKLPFLLH